MKIITENEIAKFEKDSFGIYRIWKKGKSRNRLAYHGFSEDRARNAFLSIR